MQELVKRLRRFAEERDWEQFHSPKNLSMALSVEVAEIVEHFQWLTEEESRRLGDDKREELAEEIGDVMIYLVNLADKLGIDPLRSAKEKLEKNETKYPAGLVKGKSQKYTEY
jgi:NTP pyrophosphatase (non-canonical NTP hydrolase)